jgi:uncharacterized protein (TIGR00255 family)
MLSSMTAYARAEASEPWGTATWELRSVNNRFLDVSPRLPEELRALDPRVRDCLKQRLARGKIDCTLRVSYSPEQSAMLNLDRALAKRLSELSREVDGMLHDPARVGSLDILRWPGVIQPVALDLEGIGARVMSVLDEALEDLSAARAREGTQLARLLIERLDAIDTLVADLRARLPDILAQARTRLETRVAEIAVQVDPERVEQEIALLAQKADVAEELDRLEAHVVEVRRVIEHEAPAGRRLDFLMQELNREANTLASKSIDTASTRVSVDLKVLVEQMREQVQNLE